MLHQLFLRKQEYSDPVVNPHLPGIELNKWEVSDFITNKLLPIVKNRPFPLDEQMLMVETVCYFKPALIFDWGTHVGKSARIFWETCQAFNIKSEIHSIDLPDDEEHVEHPGITRGELVKNCKEVQLHQGDGVATAIDIYTKKNNPKKRALFYVDGDHSFSSVKRELNIILNKVNDPIILLHDTLYRPSKSGYNVGPNKAIKECLRISNKKIYRVDTQLGLPGMTLLYTGAPN